MDVFWSGGCNGYNPALVGGTGTTAKVFPSLLGPGFNNGGGSLSPAAATPAMTVWVPGSGQFEQQQITVCASGYLFVHGTTPTINFVFQQGTSLTPTSNTTVATLTAAQSLTTAFTYPWYFNATFMADSVSGIMQFGGPAYFLCDGVSGALTLTNLTGVNLTTTNYGFVFGITFAVSDALNKAAISEFSLIA